MKTMWKTALLAGAAWSAATCAFAQTPAAEDSAVEELVVTARRTEESLQTVPGAVSAFSEASLDRIQATDTTGLQGAVPNLNIVQGRGSSNATNIYIRGVGQPDALQTFDPAVGVYVDDVYFSRIRGTQLDLLDLERVEVLRGPQGTLYGKNTIGGALKVVTRKPGQTLRWQNSLAVGSYGQMEIKSSLSGPITDTLAGGVAGMVSARDGYVTDPVRGIEYNDKNTRAVRAALAWTPSDDFRLDLAADHNNDDAAMTVGQPVNSLTYLFGGTLLPLPAALPDYDFTGRTTPGLPNETRLEHWGVSATAAWELSDSLTLKSITAYRSLATDDHIDIDATQTETGDVLVAVDQNQVSQEFQLNYETGALTVVGGLFYMRELIESHQEAYADDLINTIYGPPPFTTSPTFLRTVDDDLETTSLAAYANASYSLTQALRVSAGVRYTQEEKDYWRTTSTFSSNALFNGTPAPFDPSDTWEDVSPMASVDYRFTDDTMVYARVSRGYKSGGFNGRANQATERTAYEPETMVSYEVGVKTTIMDGLRLNVAIFDNSYKDFQARVSGLTTDPSLPGVPFPALSVINAGELEIRGAELEASWSPVRGLLLDSQIGYLDARYAEFDDTRFTSTGGSRAFQDPAFSPEWTARYGAQYAFDLSGGSSVTVGGQARFRSEAALAIDNTFTNSTTRIEGLYQEDYWLYDARVVWDSAGGRFSAGVYGQNLADEAYKTDGQEFSSIGSIRTVYYGAPRTWTVRLTARY